MDQSNTCHPLHIILNQENLLQQTEEVHVPENYTGKSTGEKVVMLNRGEGGSNTEISTFPDSRYVLNKEPTTPRLARGIKEATAQNIVDSSGQYRPLDGSLHVKDLSIAHIYAFEYLMSNKKNITLNLGTGIGYSVAEIIKFAEKYKNKKISYRVQNRRLGDIERLIACSKFAKEKINWFAQFSDIENIFQSMWNVYKNL